MTITKTQPDSLCCGMTSSDVRWFELLLAAFLRSASPAMLVVITACRRVINLALNGQTILQTEPPWASMKTEKPSTQFPTRMRKCAQTSHSTCDSVSRLCGVLRLTHTSLFPPPHNDLSSVTTYIPYSVERHCLQKRYEQPRLSRGILCRDC